jgi:myo-inositol-1(or 4)-monophosphatase
MITDLVNISKEAGQLVKEKFGKNLEIEFKTNELNLVTEADKASEKLITDFIKKKFPSHGVLAEEGSEINTSAEYLWVVDPLDGTTNFAHGLPIFSVSIGLQKNGQTIAGVVYEINQNIIYAAELGSGATANDKKIKVSTNSILAHSMLVTGFPYDIKDNPDYAFERFITMIKSSRAVRRLGSAAIDFCYLAKGAFDGFWEVHLHPWDICAGKLIVEEAGGLITDFDGRRIDIYSKRILCSNGKIHDQIIEKLKTGI